MKILHTADIHLREYKDDRWKMLQKLIEIGKKEEIDKYLWQAGKEYFPKNYFKYYLKPTIER